MYLRRKGVFAFTALLIAVLLRPGHADDPVDFARDIRPILSDNCYTCHGPDEKLRMGKLRLDTRDGAFAKPGVIVAGEASASRLVQRITTHDAASRMPPPAIGRSLTEKQIELLTRWVSQGAKWEDRHWAYVAPRRVEPPQVKDTAWPKNPIDRFTLARLEREGLHPSPEARPEVLLRRLSLDLTGLPPTPAELSAFVADKSPDAWEKQVERLLGSPHHGERLAMQWLDLARYADSHGYHIDSHRDMWRWRDWVIKAFNDNMPFDRFTIEQLAGDLLPNATLEQRMASGFNRNHMINFEGGAIPEEYHVEYVVDRVETTANVWMGTTLGCARCHNHKYDPFSQKEFYQFFAFFNSVDEEGLDGRTGNAKPLLALPSHEQTQTLEALRKDIRELETALADETVQPLQEQWEATFRGKPAEASRAGLAAHFELDGSLSDVSGGYRHGRTVQGDPGFGSGRVGRALSLDGDTRVSFGNAGDFDSGMPFTLAVWTKGGSNVPRNVIAKAAGRDSPQGYEIAIDELELIGIQRRAGKFVVRISGAKAEDRLELRSRERYSLGDWHHVALVSDGTGKASGTKLLVDGTEAAVAVVRDAFAGSFRTAADLEAGNPAVGKPYAGQLDDLRVYSRALSPAEVADLAVDYPIRAILSGVGGKRSKEDATRCREYFLTRVAPRELKERFERLGDLRRRKTELEQAIPTVMVMSELPKPRETKVLARGDYRNGTEKVEPDVPAVLPPLPKGAPHNRLTLARWLVDPSHPLTARVAVNRFWQMYFGTGIVKTAEDFGSQGEAPVHPELLDWLATEFIRTGWDVRAMQRLIVTSATYRQSSVVTPALHERDPENRLLARGPRFRLPAEVVRDNALAVSGLLVPEIGGPPVFPYQPPGIWEELAFGDGFSAQSYTPGSGDTVHRRSMYTFWKRTAPQPAMLTFDAPDREKCTARRLMTNTPLQALVLMNDPTYVEAARALAYRTLSEAGKDWSSRVAHAFRLATGRSPLPEEKTLLKELLESERSRLRRDPGAAEKLLGVGLWMPPQPRDPLELAAWTIVSSAILNLDETITRQ